MFVLWKNKKKIWQQKQNEKDKYLLGQNCQNVSFIDGILLYSVDNFFDKTIFQSSKLIKNILLKLLISITLLPCKLLDFSYWSTQSNFVE